MNENIRELQEDIVLENCFISEFPNMVHNDDKAFYKFMRGYIRDNYSATADAVREAVVVNLLKEVIVLANQIWKVNPSRFDERLIKNKNVFDVIKRKISKDGKPLPFNTRELYKRIRQAISHNSKTKSNFIYNLHHFELNLGKVDGDDYIIELEVFELYELFSVLFANKQEGSRLSVSYYEEEIHSREDVKEFIELVDDENKTIISLDDNQVERVYNYFSKATEDKTIVGSRKVLDHIIALPDNPEVLLSEKIMALSMLASMKSNSTYKQIKDFNKFLSNPIFVVSTYFSIVSNLLFRIVSSQTNAEIETMLEGCGLGLNGDQIRHLRNSLCHGRYFHDYYNSFYFYDGAKELSFQLKLTVEDINKMLDSLAKGLYSIKTFAKKY